MFLLYIIYILLENEREKPLQENNEKRSNELLKQMEKVDKDISEVTQKITDLKDKQVIQNVICHYFSLWNFNNMIC